MNVTWTTKYRTAGVAMETSGQLYGKYRWHTDGRVTLGQATLTITRDEAEASAVVAACEAGEELNREWRRVERLVRPTWYVLGTALVVREDDDCVRLLRSGILVGEFASVAATIEWIDEFFAAASCE